MKKLSVKRILSMLLAFSLLLGVIPMVAPVEAQAVGGIDDLTCAGFISNTWHRTYIDTMMKHYLNTQSKLRTALDNGKNVIFMFEGGSDNYPSNTYEDSAYDTRTQAVVIVVKKNSSGNAYIAFYSENCSSLPDDPDDCTGAAHYGAVTIIDGIYGIQTINHTGPYGALNTYASEGYYTPPANQNGYMNGCSGVNIHTRTSAGSGGGWSLGCQVIGYGNSSSNEFNAFMKAVAGITYNVWVTYKSALYTITAYRDMGYYVLDRQLGCENASGTYFGSGSLIQMYNSTALTNITAWSAAQRAQANFGYLSQCTPYASHCEVEVTEDTQINSLPCSVGTEDSETIEYPNVGDRYTATKMYKNSYGNYWYEVSTKNGKTGYLYAGAAQYIKDSTTDIALTGATFPNGHVEGSTFVVNGTIKAPYNQITKASVYIRSGFGSNGTAVTGYEDSVSGSSYALANSTIDAKTDFGSLSEGQYTYDVDVQYINYYADGATTLKSNTGSISLAEEYFMVVGSSVNQSSCNHYNTTTVLKPSTCTSTGGSVVSCSICGKVETKTDPASGHSYSQWVVVNPTCTVAGSRSRSCINCGDTERETIEASHKYNLKIHEATCKEYRIYEYTCSACGHNYQLNAAEMTNQWVAEIPEGMDPGLFTTKTQYRYADCTSTSWVKSGSDSVTYVSEWASGFDKTSVVYSQYNKPKVTAGETDTTKIVVNSDQKVGYLWYHWCDTTKTSSWAYETDPYHTFHTYFGTTDPSNYPCDTSDYSYGTAHSSCSNATYWFPMDVYKQSYTTYTLSPDGKQWGSWSPWSDTSYTAAANSRKVETRTVYKLKTAALGTHSWNEGVCSICKLRCEHNPVNETCTICGMYIPSKTFYMFGYINGADYGCEADYETLGEYKFKNGKLTALFSKDSYVAVKTEDNLEWYMTNGYLGDVQEATLYNTTTAGMNFDKLFVPKGHDITFTLVDNKDGTLHLSYTAVACPHTTHDIDGHCLYCGVTVEHNYVNGYCICGFEEPRIDEFYLFGYINGEDYAYEGDYENLGIYKFVENKLSVTFTENSYIGVKSADNKHWYMTNGWLGEGVKRATMYESTVLAAPDKLFVPGGVQINFTLDLNANGTLQLSYEIQENKINAPTLTLKSPALEFKDMIRIAAYYTVSSVADVMQMGMITYKTNVSNWSVETAENVIPGYTYDSTKGYFCATSEGIHAKYLGDTYYMAVYAQLTDGSYVYSKLASYSPKTYAYNQLKGSNATLKSLMVAMLNYGATAQYYFGYKTDNYVNKDLTAEQKQLVTKYSASLVDSNTAVDSSKVGIFTNNSGFSKRSPAVSFEGAFCINYFFTPKYAPTNGNMKLYYWTQEAYESASVLKASNASGSIKMINDGTGAYHAVIEGISAKDINKTIYVAAGYTSNGVSYCTGVLPYSIGAYCVSKAGTTDTIQPLAKATAVYGYYARQMFSE